MGDLSQIRISLTPLVLLIVAVAAHGAQSSVQTSIELNQALRSDEFVRLDQRLHNLVSRTPLDLDAVRTVIESTKDNGLAYEFLLHRFAMYLRQNSPDDATLKYLATFQDYDSQAQVWHEEGPLPIVVFPVSTAVRGTLRLEILSRTSERVKTNLQRGNLEPLNILMSESLQDPVVQGTLLALTQMELSLLEDAKDHLVSDRQKPPVQEALITITLRTHDKALAKNLLSGDDGKVSLTLIRGIKDSFDVEDSFELLKHATSKADIASVALFEMVRLDSGKHPGVKRYLLEKLDSLELGSAAAAAIARSRDPELLLSVSKTLAETRVSDAAMSNAVLALRLANNAMARNLLSTALSNNQIKNPRLKQQVNQWLRN